MPITTGAFSRWSREAVGMRMMLDWYFGWAVIGSFWRRWVSWLQEWLDSCPGGRTGKSSCGDSNGQDGLAWGRIGIRRGSGDGGQNRSMNLWIGTIMMFKQRRFSKDAWHDTRFQWRSLVYYIILDGQDVQTLITSNFHHVYIMPPFRKTMKRSHILLDWRSNWRFYPSRSQNVIL